MKEEPIPAAEPAPAPSAADAPLAFQIVARARGGPEGNRGLLSVDGHSISYSAPASMGGPGEGASPETLLLAAVSSCYSLTLLAYLAKRRLPHGELELRTRGEVGGYPGELRYLAVEVSPRIEGADAARRSDYENTAAQALSKCFIGQTLARSGLAYRLGAVELG